MTEWLKSILKLKKKTQGVPLDIFLENIFEI